jgi:ribosomal protein S18 acetylase RimI-like enzyme
LEESRVDDAVDILVRAFKDDPILTFYFHAPSRRVMAFRTFFGDIVRGHMKFGHVYAALVDYQVVGVAVWRPPGEEDESLHGRLRGLCTHLWLRLLFPRTSSELFRGFQENKRLHPQEPHWYLFFMGVDKDLQGRGIGSRLLTPVLELADRSQTLCYLETPFPKTHIFYQRLGFEIKEESYVFRGAPLWTMIRLPKRI